MDAMQINELKHAMQDMTPALAELVHVCLLERQYLIDAIKDIRREQADHAVRINNVLDGMDAHAVRVVPCTPDG